MSHRAYGCVIGFLLLGLFRPSSVIASRSVRIVSPSFTLISDQPEVVTASASGFTDGEQVHIKGALFRDGSTNYFGFTENGGAWVKNSAPTEIQRSVDIHSWDGTIKIRADFTDSGFTGDGQYLFKIRYYYGENGNEWSENSVPVTILAPTPTVTPVPTPTTTPTPREATPTPSVTPSTTPTVTVFRPKTVARKRSLVASSSAILGIQEDGIPNATDEGEDSIDTIMYEAPDTVRIRILLGLGMIVGIVSAVLAYIQFGIWKKLHDQKDE